MFLIDDSACIRGNSSVWSDIRRSLAIFVHYATIYDEDGVDLAFIHTGNQYQGITSGTDLMTLFDKERISGVSRSLSLSLDRHLATYKKKYQDQTEQGMFPKPLNLIVLTSGGPGAMDDFENTVIRYATLFEDMNAPMMQLGIQFVLIHSQPEDQLRFQLLDDISLRKPQIR